MQPQFSINGFPPGMPGMGSFQLIALCTAIWGFAVLIFWMICAWRAMRAHERLATAVEQLVSGNNNVAESKHMPPLQE